MPLKKHISVSKLIRTVFALILLVILFSSNLVSGILFYILLAFAVLILAV